MPRSRPRSEQAGSGRPIPVPGNQPVTQYHLSGEDVKIVFRAGTEDTAMLEYNGEIYRGRALHHEQTLFGRVISVILETIPDLHTMSLSLTVPEANRPGDMRSISIDTFAVITTSRTSIGGPALVSGQLQTYRLVPLEGNAW